MSDYEYAPFGDSKNPNRVLRRDADDPESPWEEVPDEDLVNAQVQVQVKLQMQAERRAQRQSGLVRVSTVKRDSKNESLAAELGLTADEFAERLASPKDNRGTLIRVPEGRFDEIAAEKGMDPGEMRDRFSGRFWVQEVSDEDKGTAKAEE